MLETVQAWRERYERAVATIGHLRDICRNHRDDAYRANRRLIEIRDYAQAVLDGEHYPCRDDFALDVLDIINKPRPANKWEEALIPYLEN